MEKPSGSDLQTCIFIVSLVFLVSLVSLVYLVYMVCLVYLVYLVILMLDEKSAGSKFQGKTLYISFLCFTL
jgi:hypothetical protein